MAITQYTTLTDFDTVTGTVTENSSQYHTQSPSFLMSPGSQLLDEFPQSTNVVLKTYVRFDDISHSWVRFHTACDSNGNGRALELHVDGGVIKSTYGDWSNGSGLHTLITTPITETQLENIIRIPQSQFIEIQIQVSNHKMRLYVGGVLAIDVNDFSSSGQFFGIYTGVDGGQVYASDYYRIDDQIIHGNVNLNGAPDDTGVVFLHNQSSYKLIEKTNTDANGNYMIFVDDDPANLNKYFLYGFIPGIGTTQPRGVSNILL